VKREQLTNAAVFCALVGLAVTVRLLTEMPNFGAVTAAALFAGFYFRDRRVALAVPLATLLISDRFLGGYDSYVMAAVYFSQSLPIAWRGLLRKSLSPLTVGAGAVSSSLVFYGLTNGAVWYVWYPHTLEGLTRCYTTALPFLAGTLASDILFSAGFFSLYAFATQFRDEPVREIAADAA